MRLILQPAGSSAAKIHYRDTIVHPVPLVRFRTHLSNEHFDLVRRLHPAGAAAWGVTPGANGLNAKKWEAIQPGDAVLLTGGGGVLASATVSATFHAPELARELWGEQEGGHTWEYMYTLDDVEERDVSYETLNRLLGYKLNNIVQGFQVLPEEKSWPVLDYLDLVQPDHHPAVTKEEYHQFLEALEKLDSLDKVRQGTARVEQPYLRQRLFNGMQQAECVVCQRNLPTQFLDAAHVKPRPDCSRSERLDVEGNIVALCRLGCHVLFDAGLVTIKEGRVTAKQGSHPGTDLEEYLARLDGARSPTWTPDKSNYFRWHAEHVFDVTT